MVASGVRIIPDPFPDFPPELQIVLQIVFLLLAFLSGWVVFNTSRAMNWMARQGPPWYPGRETAIRLANKPGWVWFYRIDCAVVFIGVVLILITHWLSR
jgi:hypothetical protein